MPGTLLLIGLPAQLPASSPDEARLVAVVGSVLVLLLLCIFARAVSKRFGLPDAVTLVAFGASARVLGDRHRGGEHEDQDEYGDGDGGDDPDRGHRDSPARVTGRSHDGAKHTERTLRRTGPGEVPARTRKSSRDPGIRSRCTRPGIC